MSEIIAFIQANGELTAASILALVVLLIVFGVLVPYRQVRTIIAERDAWHAAHTVSESARAKLSEEQFKMLETMRISKTFFSDFVKPVPHDAPADNPPNVGTVAPGGPDATV